MDAVQRLSVALAERYVIERELGEGGMATVYLAHDVKHDRKVALKVLRPELASILGAERFLSEIKTTANLQHPHILPLHDSGEADGLVFYVMPYVEGESLRDRLTREKQLPVEDAVRVAREVASALDYAHRHGVVHRDIKPENILLHDGRALVADFGIALAVSSAGGGTRLTETGMSLGTPHYMSPEQAMGEREITAKSDVYALGCVVYEMLVGEPPFTGPTAQAIVARVMTEQPRSLALQRRTIPPHVEAAVQKALEKLPADRFGSAAQFAEALGNRDFSVPVTLAAPGAADRGARRAADSARRWVPWAVAALAVVVAGFGWMRRSGPAAATDPVRFYHVPDSGHSATSACCGPPLAISPDGRTLAYEGLTQRIQVWVRALSELAARPLAGTEGARNLFFSPDGQWVGYSSSGNLMKVPVAGGAPVTIAEIGSQLLGATWTADNHIVFARVDSSGLFRVTADGGTPERLTRPDTTAGESGHFWPHYVPETNGLLFTVWPRTGALGAAHVGLMRLGRRE
ncbi:MAG: protein kinase, partial [Gemmatimonadales bacterium]|nr:protein kinase [Gemmatimonadales bacterium]